MKKPVHVKLRAMDAVVGIARMEHGPLAADKFLVATKMGHFYILTVSVDSEVQLVEVQAEINAN